MGLLSKLFNQASSDLGLDKIAKTVADAVEESGASSIFSKVESLQAQAEKLTGRKKEANQAASSDSYATSSANPSASFDEPSSSESTPPGQSWGPTMPAEENQFNFKGNYKEYFDSVFRNDFPQYRVERKASEYLATIYTFFEGEQQVLVVEVLSDHSAAQKLRRDCLRSGMPYVRFYHDHDGWWNTRSYVTERCRKAIARQL